MAQIAGLLMLLQLMRASSSISGKLRSKLTSPRCAEYGVSYRDAEGDWQAGEVLLTALQCQL
ncbi:unnamed protein product, partial [Symbiodinium necroappetens]